MNKFSKISLFISIFLLIFSAVSVARAVFSVSSVTISQLENNHATLSWTTSVPTKAVVSYGSTPDDLNIRLSYGVSVYQHDLVLNGLETKKTYYYKIVAIDDSGLEVTTFLQSFSTKDMADTVAPKLIYNNTEQITDNALALRWVSDENTRGTIYYGIEGSTTVAEKIVKDGALKKDHIVYIYNLKAHQPYYVKLHAEDKAGNMVENTFYFTPNSPIKDGSLMEIYAVQPQAFDAELIRPESATIQWSTTLVCASSISYGTKAGSHGKTVQADNGAYGLDHQADLGDLKPNTIYYYVINARDCLYKKNMTSREYSFSTSVPQKVLGVKIGDNQTDSDGDGYPDSLEVTNHYNPWGYGRVVSQLVNQQISWNVHEKSQLTDLQNIVRPQIDKINLDTRSWYTYANAYIYGGYSVSDIVRSIKGAKTVHPNFSLEVWQTSADYQL